MRLDDIPRTANGAAGYSKRRREDTQVLHPEIARRLEAWLATKPDLGPDDLLFPVSDKVPGGVDRKTAKMMRLDLEAARKKWIKEAETDDEKQARGKSDFLSYCDENGQYADFHSNRHVHHQPVAGWRVAQNGADVGSSFRHPFDDGHIHPHWSQRPRIGNRIAPTAAG